MTFTDRSGWPVFLGDDLSGSAESAAVLRGIGARAPELHLEPTGAKTPQVAFTDLDTRYADRATIARRLHHALGRMNGRRVVLKIDSLLRGNLVDHVQALDPEHNVVIVAPALPRQRRHVVNGVPLIDDVPLNVSTAVDTWRIAERTEPPATIAEALAPLNVQHITPESCRGLSSQISRAALVGKVVIADAVSDADLDRLVAASWRITNCRYVGSAGLVSAIARRLGARSDALADGLPSAAGALPAGSLVVVGTSESTARRQLDEISRQGGVVVGVPLTRSSDNGPVDVTAIASHLERTTVALTIRRGPPETSTRDGLSGDAAAALGAAVEHVLAATARPPRLMLTGGHTARVVLDRLRLTRLRVHGVVHYGAVALDADNRARVITRPGSFGDVDSFVLGARYLADWSFSTGNGATEQKTRSIDPRRGAS